MKTATKLLLILAVVTLLPGCCLRAVRTNRCLLCRPTVTCLRQQIGPPSQWCWGNCQIENLDREQPGYMNPDAAGLYRVG